MNKQQYPALALLRTSLTLLAFHSFGALAADGKLIATAGLSQIEGSGGGGIVPWATISGYDSRDQISAGAVVTQVDVDDYRLTMLGASLSFYDNVELSIAQQRFEIKGAGIDIKQNIVGVKYRLYGDVVYSDWPQLSVGMQYKHLEDPTVASAVGAKNSNSGTDFYLAATKVHLGAIGGYNAVWNLTARATKANEMGILGFGGVNNDSYELMLEASAGILFSRNIAVGIEYRQKPDNLGLGEDNWTDYFISYIPSKDFNLTVAWAELGTIAGAAGQSGLYLSLNGQLW
jgi:hypothetical protein